MARSYLTIKNRPFFFGGEGLVVDGREYYVKYKGDSEALSRDLARKVIESSSLLKGTKGMEIKITT